MELVGLSLGDVEGQLNQVSVTDCRADGVCFPVGSLFNDTESLSLAFSSDSFN
jgi:hypothetical protein